MQSSSRVPVLFSVVLDLTGHYRITEVEQQVTICNNLLFHLSDLFFHLSKIMSCSKRWKSVLEVLTDRLCYAKKELTTGLVYTE